MTKNIKTTVSLFFLCCCNYKVVSTETRAEFRHSLFDYTMDIFGRFPQCPGVKQSFEIMCNQPFFSCERQCGLHKDLYCFCDQLCVRLGDCCHDFEQACPELHQSAYDDQLLRGGELDYYCKSETVVISSCPLNSPQQEQPNHLDSNADSEFSGTQGVRRKRQLEETLQPQRKKDNNKATGQGLEGPASWLRLFYPGQHWNSSQTTQKLQVFEAEQEKQLEKESTGLYNSSNKVVVDLKRGLLFSDDVTLVCNGGNIGDMQIYSNQSSKLNVSLRKCYYGHLFDCDKENINVDPCAFHGMVDLSAICYKMNQAQAISFKPETTTEWLKAPVSEPSQSLITSMKSRKCKMSEKIENLYSIFWFLFRGNKQKSTVQESQTDVADFVQVKGKKNRFIDEAMNKTCFPYMVSISYEGNKFESSCEFLNLRNKILKIVTEINNDLQMTYENNSNTLEIAQVYTLKFIIVNDSFGEETEFLSILYDKLKNDLKSEGQILKILKVCISYKDLYELCQPQEGTELGQIEKAFGNHTAALNGDKSTVSQAAGTGQPCTGLSDVYEIRKKIWEATGNTPNFLKADLCEGSENLGQKILSLKMLIYTIATMFGYLLYSK